MTRQAFLLALPEAMLARQLAGTGSSSSAPKLLIVAAHPDDEYAFAATTYRLTRELGWTTDHVVVTNGEAGYRYSALAEALYGVTLTREGEGRSRLPAIRKRETLNAGKVLGIRRHYFLGQRDSGFNTDAAGASTANWDRARMVSFLTALLHRERYDAIFTLLPTSQTHAHHRAATLLAVEAAASLPEEQRPLIFAADPCASGAPSAGHTPLAGEPLARTVSEHPVFSFDRATSFGYRNALNYQIVVNWVIAEHKSQGLFQTDSGKDRLEQFWLFEASGSNALSRAHRFAAELQPAAESLAAAG